MEVEFITWFGIMAIVIFIMAEGLITLELFDQIKEYRKKV